MYREFELIVCCLDANPFPSIIVVVDEASKEGAVVDPYDWQKMLDFVKDKGVNVRKPGSRYQPGFPC